MAIRRKCSSRKSVTDRFLMLLVDRRVAIRDFVEEHGFKYVVGNTYYELAKPEIVQGNKNVVAVSKLYGEILSGDKAAAMMKLPTGLWPFGRPDTRVNPKDLSKEMLKYVFYVQSMSTNRILLPGSRVVLDTWEV